MTSQLEQLPLEALDLISRHLALEWKPSLYSFALVSKRCHAAASSHRFRHVHIKIVSRKRLDRDVKQWESILGSTLSFQSVRQLTLEGLIPIRKLDKGEFEPLEENPNLGESVDDLTCMHNHNHLSVYKNSFGEYMWDNELWEPLSRLLSRMTGLQDLIYACINQLAPCILQVLHEHLPRCRLHMHAFKLCTLLVDILSDHERDLVASPNLHCIITYTSTFEFESDTEENERLTKFLASGEAPNLRSVHSAYSRLEKLSPDETLGSYPRGRLQKLSLQYAPKEQFLCWQRKIDMSALQTLHLWKPDLDTVEMASQCQFSALKTLVLDLLGITEKSSQVDRAGSTFLRSLPPLQSLLLLGHFGQESFQATLDCHGSSLRKLALLPCHFHAGEDYVPLAITPTRLTTIQAHCPNLRDLRLRILRTQGDKHEVEIYRTLGAMRQLRDLEVQLECSRGLARCPNTGVIPISCPRGDLINGALDETLARAIFGVLIEQGSRVEQLKLDVRPNRWGAVEIERIMEMMSRKWRCVRVRGHDSDSVAGDRILVEERGVLHRKQRGRNDDGWGEFEAHEDIFRQLWPDKTGSWKKDWHSFPLSLD